MLERRRAAKYNIIPGGEGGEDDVELGESSTIAGQETGVTSTGPSLDHEIDNWDENAEDAWDEEDAHGTGESTSGDGQKTPPSTGDEVDVKKS